MIRGRDGYRYRSGAVRPGTVDSVLPSVLYRVRCSVLCGALLWGAAGCGPAPEAEPIDVAAGERLVEMGRYREAADLFGRATAAHPDSADLFVSLARALALDEDLEGAVRAYRRAVELAPEQTGTHTRLAVVLSRLDRFAEATSTLETALQVAPDDARARCVLGQLQFREGLYIKAAASYRRATEADEGFGEAWYGLGQTCLKQSDLEGAEAAFARAAATDSTDGRFPAALGLVHYQRRDYGAAVAQLERAVELAPLYAKAHQDLGNAYTRLGKRDEGRAAVETFRRLQDQERRMYALKNLILREPGKATLYHDLAVIHGQRGEFGKARQRYIQAVTRDTNYAACYHNLGNIQLRGGRLREAMGLYRRALRADSTYALAYLSMGNLHMMRREFAAAHEAYSAGLVLTPDDDALSKRAALASKALAASAAEE